MAKVKRMISIDEELNELVRKCGIDASKESRAGICSKLGHPQKPGTYFCYCGEVLYGDAPLGE